MATNNQKAQIHILKADLGLSRSDYEGLLAPYGVSSSADGAFTTAKANQLIATMRRMADGRPSCAKASVGVRETADVRRQTADDNSHQPSSSKGRGRGWGKNKYEYLRPRPEGMADPKQLRKIEAMWRDLARDPSDAALENFLERQTGIRNIAWLKHAHAVAMICAEDAMKAFGDGKCETADERSEMKNPNQISQT